MNIETLSWRSARKICIVQTLSKLGHYPTRTTEKEAWFLSPLRSETQASFNVSLTKNLWFDFGIGKGGNIINLIMLLKSCTFREAINYLSNGFDFFFYQPVPLMDKKKSSSIDILKTQSITHPALLNYLNQRKISISVAQKICKEVWYSFKEKEYFAVGLQNISGGWELRNKFYKTSNSPKTYSYLKNNSTRLIVFEGMFDLLSMAEMFPERLENTDIVVLNSLSFLEPASLLFTNYKEIELYLDNDTAGKKRSKELVDQNSQVKDASYLFEGFKDLNEKLVFQRTLEKTALIQNRKTPQGRIQV